MKYCLSHNLGSENKHSTTDTLTKFIGDILEGFDKNMICLSVFIDLKKKHLILLIIISFLTNYDAVEPQTDVTLNLYKGYLSNQKQKVVIDDIKSDLKQLHTGCTKRQFVRTSFIFTMYK